MATRGENDEPSALKYKACCYLVLEIVRDEFAGIFRFWHLFWKATKAVDNADLLLSWLQRLLRAYLRDLAGGEGVIRDNGRPIRNH
jgi:hypothetical protein